MCIRDSGGNGPADGRGPLVYAASGDGAVRRRIPRLGCRDSAGDGFDGPRGGRYGDQVADQAHQRVFGERLAQQSGHAGLFGHRTVLVLSLIHI